MEETMKCPFCLNEIKKGAKKCKFCHEMIENNETKNPVINETPEQIKEKKEVQMLVTQAIVFIVLLILFFNILGNTGNILFLFLLLLVCVRYSFCSKEDKNLYDYQSIVKRIKSKSKKRIIFGSILTVIVLLFGIATYGPAREEALHRKTCEKTPPTLSVTSKEGNIGDETVYNLTAEVSGVNYVSYVTRDGSGDINITDGKIQKEFNVSATNFAIKLTYKGDCGEKEKEKEIKLERNKTEEEIQKEKEEKEAKKALEKQGKIDLIDTYITMMKQLNPKEDTFTLELYEIVAAKKQYEDMSNETDSDITKKLGELKTAIINGQKSFFPKARKVFCEKAKKEMRIKDIDVSCNGSTITFVNSSFVKNANIQASHEAIYQTLYDLRFDRANYKWTKSSYAEYTYYDLKSKKDSEW